jgi:hypothetical protein
MKYLDEYRDSRIVKGLLEAKGYAALGAHGDLWWPDPHYYALRP